MMQQIFDNFFHLQNIDRIAALTDRGDIKKEF